MTDGKRGKIADRVVALAEQGSIPHYEIITRTLGEAVAEQPQLNPIAALVVGDSAVRGLAQGFFAALAMGLRDAGGLGVVREPEALDSLAAPDDDQ